MEHVKGCTHKTIHLQKSDPLITGGNLLYKCHDCGQKFTAREWDGKFVPVVAQKVTG